MIDLLQQGAAAWWFYLTNEGNSASITAKLVTIATSIAIVGVGWIVLRIITGRWRL